MIACDCFPRYKHDIINLVNFVINDLVKSNSVLSSKTEVKLIWQIKKKRDFGPVYLEVGDPR